jgi:hypothetical protein
VTLPRLIGITGAAGSGKDSLADLLVYDRGATKYSFARPIKEALNAMFGWTMEQWDDRVWKEAVLPWLGKSPRVLAQTLGTEWGRELIHPEMWVLLGAQRFREHAGTGPFVIPDMRFDNEAQMVRQLGGVVIKVHRPGVAAIAAHKSEAGVSSSLIDWNAMNDRSLREYLEATLHVLDGWSAT